MSIGPNPRLEAARAYVARKPEDRFGLYTLAMELRKAKRWEECFEMFQRLLDLNPGYGTGWYHYGMATRESGDPEGCIVILRRGLAATELSGDNHAHAEIEEALEEMG
jgi:tetratricopeptide (TPR) repeat protein